MPSISYKDIRGSKLLIVGDVNTGKTTMTKELLDKAIASDPGQVTVIDMAPRALMVEDTSFGGFLVDPEDHMRRRKLICLISD